MLQVVWGLVKSPRQEGGRVTLTERLKGYATQLDYLRERVSDIESWKRTIDHKHCWCQRDRAYPTQPSYMALKKCCVCRETK